METPSPTPAEIPPVVVHVNMGRSSQTEATSEVPVHVNMGRREIIADPETVPTPTELDLGETVMGSMVKVESIESTNHIPEISPTKRATNALIKQGVIQPDGTVHPDLVAALVAEGHSEEEINNMSPTTLKYVLEQAADESLRDKDFTYQLTEATPKEATVVDAENIDGFLTHILAGGSYTADGESRTLQKSESGVYYFVKPDGSRGANLGSENRVRQFFGTKIDETPGRFTF